MSQIFVALDVTCGQDYRIFVALYITHLLDISNFRCFEYKPRTG
jgi:hypothetical protein